MRAILTYHSIDESGSPISVSPEAFRAHVRWLASGAVRVLPLEEVVQRGDGQDAVAITFDDGFENFATCALPALRDAGLPVTVFVVAEHAGGENDWGGRHVDGIPALPLMSWDTLGRAREHGVTLGAHTRRHRDLTTVRGAALEDEVAGCVERIAAELGQRPTHLRVSVRRRRRDLGDGGARCLRAGLHHRVAGVARRRGPGAPSAARHVLFREAGQLEAWGRPSFRGRLWLRARDAACVA